ncbi:MAG: hypothetical protein LC658_04650 [Bacteroidales bacterium]|nr:hypothetical protein [Bacteroidales bacterium]
MINHIVLFKLKDYSEVEKPLIIAANWIVFGLISFTLAKLLMTLYQ